MAHCQRVAIQVEIADVDIACFVGGQAGVERYSNSTCKAEHICEIIAGVIRHVNEAR
jgi:hypothetical protein